MAEKVEQETVEPEVDDDAVARRFLEEDNRPLADQVADAEGEGDETEGTEDEDEESPDEVVTPSGTKERSKDFGQQALIELLKGQQKQIELLSGQFKKLTGGEGGGEDDFGYDVGPIDDPNDRGFEELRPTWNRHGKFVLQEVRKVEKRLEELSGVFEDWREESKAEAVKTQMKVSDEEEDQIATWAQGMGFRYTKPAQLKRVIAMYRKFVADKADEKNGKRKRAANGNPPATPITSTTKKSEEQGLETVSGDPYQKAYARAVRKTLKDLRQTT